ncbi:unnamed protein product [Penicillium egyptiacum]|uniref:Uncharacterized protein n=1 Tax=Penicillium egyptiacum TaxID=1303716 RepID=A0A9W4K7Z9_9EURO|nr:unnamed protein product [Penicillium egyptiacum]
MNTIQMLGSPNIVYICYDLFLDECDERIRTEISESVTKRPIHQITQKGKVYIMRRDERLDVKVAQRYVHMSTVDKGPRPFFSDLKDPPFYNEHGRRIESWEEGYVPVAAMLREERIRDERRGQEELDDNKRLDKQ